MTALHCEADVTGTDQKPSHFVVTISCTMIKFKKNMSVSTLSAVTHVLIVFPWRKHRFFPSLLFKENTAPALFLQPFLWLLFQSDEASQSSWHKCTLIDRIVTLTKHGSRQTFNLHLSWPHEKGAFFKTCKPTLGGYSVISLLLLAMQTEEKLLKACSSWLNSIVEYPLGVPTTIWSDSPWSKSHFAGVT